jgi:hypothetical protein
MTRLTSESVYAPSDGVAARAERRILALWLS